MNDSHIRGFQRPSTFSATTRFPRLFAVSAALLFLATAFFAVTTPVQAQVSPVGIWDFTIQGDGRGAAVIEFFEDGTLTGFSIKAPAPKASSGSGSSSNPRNGGLDGIDPRTGLPRNGGGSSTNAPTTNSFGAAILEGQWTADSRGRIIGFFAEIASRSDGEGESSLHTNGVSFRSTALKANSLVLRAISAENSELYRGVRSGAAPDITGDFFAEGKKGGLPFADLFSLSPFLFDNVYEIAGNGAGYELGGFAILTANGVLTVQPQRSSGTFMSVTGKFKTTTGSGVLKGEASDDSGRVSYRVYQR